MESIDKYNRPPLPRVSLRRQIGAMIWRLSKRATRDKGQFISENLQALFFACIIILFGVLLNSNKTAYPVTLFPATALNRTGPPGLASPLKLAVVPSSAPDALAIVSDAFSNRMNLSSSIITPYQSENEFLADYYAANSTFYGAIIFKNPVRSPYDYTVRFPSQLPGGEQAPQISAYLNAPQQCRTSSVACPTDRYNTTGFLTIVNAINEEIAQRRLREATKNNDLLLGPSSIVLVPLSYPAALLGADSDAWRYVIPLYIILAFQSQLQYLLGGLVKEKERKLKYGMLMQGLSPEAFFLGYILYHTIFSLVLCIPLIVGLSVFVLPTSSPLAIAILILLLSLANLSFGALFSLFFTKHKTALNIGLALPIFGTALFVPLQLFNLSRGLRIFLSCLIYPLGATIAIGDELFRAKPGVTGSSGVVPGYGLSLNGLFSENGGGVYIIAVLVSLIWQILLTIYLDQVMPGEFGTPRPWYFPIQRLLKSNKHTAVDTNDDEDLEAFENPDIERDPTGSPLVVDFRGLTKVFAGSQNGNILAVDNLSLKLYQGEVFGLLGPNGAGKSTIISILTGLFPPTTCTYGRIYGYDLMTEMDYIRRLMGVVPQQNVLWDHLNVDEHVRFVVRIKCISNSQKEEDQLVHDVIERVGLLEKRTTLAKSLSGGQKRKLAFAMAFVGNPPILICDEPSTGLDPNSRRELWKLLTDEADQRLCIVTTHFMDEADFISQRKAIINNGKIVTMGTSLFLKAHYNVSYQLNLTVDAIASTTELDDLITSYVPPARRLLSSTTDPKSSAVDKDLNYAIPPTSASSFPGLFGALDNHQHIRGFGLSTPALEDVFLKLTSIGYGKGDDGNMEAGKIVAPTPPTALKHSPQFQTQFVGLYFSRYKFLLRQPRYAVMVIITPVILFILSMVVSRISGTPSADNGLNVVKYDGSDYLFDNVPYLSDVSFSGPRASSTTQPRPTTTGGLPVINAQNISAAYFDNIRDTTNVGQIGGIKASITQAGNRIDVTAQLFYNKTFVHSPGIAVQELSNAIVRAVGGEQIGNSSTSVFWQPLVNGAPTASDTSFLVAIFIIANAAMLPLSGLAVELIRDRRDKIEEQLYIVGLKRAAYYASSFCLHAPLAEISIIVLMIFVAAFQVPAFTFSSAAMGMLFVVLFVHQAMMMIFMYFLTTLFKKVEGMNAIVGLMSFFLVVLPLVAIIVTESLGFFSIAKWIHIALSLADPFYTLPGSLYKMYRIYFISQLRIPLPPAMDPSVGVVFASYWVPENEVVWGFFGMILHGILSSAGLVLRGGKWRQEVRKGEIRALQKLEKQHEEGIQDTEDDQVVAERARLLDQSNTDEQPDSSITEGVREFKVKDARKVYVIPNPNFKEEREVEMKTKKPFALPVTKTKKNIELGAVDGVTFGVRRGEVFGLLGPNGAGKSTLLSMSIGVLAPTAGALDVKLANREDEIASFLPVSHEHMGYCPQHDSLWSRLTVQEHLLLFASIKFGNKLDAINSWVDEVVVACGLEKFKNVWAENLSGGNKRKLCYAISVIGEPTLTFLDEPSSGVDPTSRRLLWNMILSARPRRATILTTHVMEEAEALSSRIGIMVNGHLRCLGTTQYLKSRFGSGYNLEISTTGENEERVQNWVHSKFPNAIAGNSFRQVYKWTVPMSDVLAIGGGAHLPIGQALGRVFEELERAKVNDGLGIAEYAFGQTSLEQAFMDIAKDQRMIVGANS
ncbi:hypothetical protein BJ742DRAFT_773845 [Cladochytrium replicatum]|nr:hypothetical protein BJ742DRAFT_773845 [Cladochytrium replicatum]